MENFISNRELILSIADIVLFVLCDDCRDDERRKRSTAAALYR